MRILFLMLLLAAAAWGEERINWYGNWKQAVSVARRCNRPILLVAAAPQCHGVSGVW